MMIEKFTQHVSQNFSFLKNKKLLLALSGGVDSVVLTHFLYNLNYDISVAHCNFKLREADSDGDEFFCKNFAKKFNIPFFTTSFSTKKYAL